MDIEYWPESKFDIRHDKRLLHTGMTFPLKVAPSHGDVDRPHLIYASLGPPDSASQTASRSVQPFLHSALQSVPILYNGPPTQNCPWIYDSLIGFLAFAIRLGWCGLENVGLVFNNLHNSAINLSLNEEPWSVKIWRMTPNLEDISLYRMCATSSALVVNRYVKCLENKCKD